MYSIGYRKVVYENRPTFYVLRVDILLRKTYRYLPTCTNDRLSGLVPLYFFLFFVCESIKSIFIFKTLVRILIIRDAKYWVKMDDNWAVNHNDQPLEYNMCSIIIIIMV